MEAEKHCHSVKITRTDVSSMQLECWTGYGNSGLCKTVPIPGRQVEYYLKIDQNAMVAVIFNGSFLSATGFRLVNLFAGREGVKEVWKGGVSVVSLGSMFIELET